MMLRCTDNHAELLKRVNAFAAEIHGGLSSVVAESCAEGAEHGRTVGKFKDQSGNLRRSVQGKLTGSTANGADGEMSADVPYASHVESGTKAHEIKARNAPLLRWVSDGAVHYAKRVWHPGTRGTPFMGPAYLKAEGLLYAKAHVLMLRAAGRFGR